MAKKFGKQRKGGKDPRDLFGAPPPPPRSSARPASSTPLADYLAPDWPGVDENYVVLPRSLAEGMSLPWQQQMSALLAQFHQTHSGLSWPVYRVVPSRYENLVDLDEEQLAEAGYLVEIDADGEMIYRERSGRKVEDPDSTRVLVSVLDPIAPRRGPRTPAAGGQSPSARPANGPGVAGPSGAPEQPSQPQRPRAVPMNIPPAPVWRSTPTRPSSSVPPLPGAERKRAASPGEGREAASGAAGPAAAAGAAWVGATGGEADQAQQYERAGSSPRHAPEQPVQQQTGGQSPAGAQPAGEAQPQGAGQGQQAARAAEHGPLPLGWELPAPVADESRAPEIEQAGAAEQLQEPVETAEPADVEDTRRAAVRDKPAEEARQAAARAEPVVDAASESAYPESGEAAEDLASGEEPVGTEQVRPVAEYGQPSAASYREPEQASEYEAGQPEQFTEAPPQSVEQQRVIPLGWEGEPPPSPWSQRAARLEPESEERQGEPAGEDRTPPRGIPQPQQPAERGWFDELTDDSDVQFGPTGQPTELPYRYRP